MTELEKGTKWLRKILKYCYCNSAMMPWEKIAYEHKIGFNFVKICESIVKTAAIMIVYVASGEILEKSVCLRSD